MSSNVGGVGAAGNTGRNAGVEKRPDYITVKKNENLTIIAKRYGMSKAEFVKWTGLKGVIRVGQKIKLPVDTVEQGKGIYALARKYGMTMAEFCNMNNISDPQNYSAKAGEVFYVRSANQKVVPKAKPKHAEKTESKPVQSRGTNSDIESSGVAAGAAVGAAVGVVAANKQKWGSSYTPQEIAEKLFDLSKQYYGAVGKPDFDALLKEINPKNASAVLKAYKENPKNENQESLIYTLATEIRSSKQSRKDAIMQVYDVLAKEKSASSEKREEFKTELDKQFDKLIGMVNTEKLDNIINGIMGDEDEPAGVSGSSTSIRFDQQKSEKGDNTKVIVPGSKYPQTVSTLRSGAIKAAKEEALQKFKSYCAAHGIKYDPKLLDTAPLDRLPKPIIDSQGNIVPYVSGLMKPTGKPNGKVIILNSGHGGYHRLAGNFDVGSYNFVKKKNGKYAPHLEYEKVQPYVNEMADKLRAEGYSVIITQGEMHSFTRTKALTNLIKDLEAGKAGDGHKYSEKDIAFVSFHADSSPKQDDENDESSVCYDPSDSRNKAFADVLNRNLNNYEGTWVKSKTAERKKYIGADGKEHSNRVGTLVECSGQIPAVLLETAHINGVKGRQNLDSSKFREQFLDSTLLGLNEYFFGKN